MTDSPAAAGQFLLALDTLLGPEKEFVVVGPRTDPATRRVLAETRSRYDPHRLVAYHDPTDGPPPTRLSLLHDRPMVDGRVTSYTCTAGVCAAPVVH
jgi:uncharacterized protein YyaL (SSP411 family)